jgi:hypothetical protein
MDNIWMWIAWKLPRRLAMWVFIRIVSNASGSDELSNKVMGEITVFDCMRYWTK